MRTLAKLVRLGQVREHPNADNLRIGNVGGWEVVVPGHSEEGDAGVYFEIDSVLPEDSQWTAILHTRKIKTMNMRGILSQGLFRHLDDVPPLLDIEFLEGKDVTQYLGVTKRPDLHEDLQNHAADLTAFDAVLSSGPPKTNEDRIQSNMELLECLQGRPFYVTRKLDGTSATYAYIGDELKALSRNFLVTTRNLEYWRIAKTYDLQRKLMRCPQWVIQGEIVGPKVQKNCLNLKKSELRVFDIWDLGSHRYLDFHEIPEALAKLNEHPEGRKLEMVDVVEVGDEFQYDLQTLLQKARGIYPGTKTLQEGIVVRSQTEPRVSFKVISNEFLIKHKQ